MEKKHFILFAFLVFLLPIKAFSLPQQVNSVGEKFILVDPNEHRWGAYDASGRLLRSGLASAGAQWCADINSPCQSNTGSFRIRSLGGSSCKSPSFPVPRGGAPMPYCMYYTPYQALHGSPHVVEGNISHGCVRMHVDDARWLRYNFAQRGTLVIIQSY